MRHMFTFIPRRQGIGINTILRTRFRRSYFSLRISNLCGEKPFAIDLTAEIAAAEEGQFPFRIDS